MPALQTSSSSASRGALLKNLAMDEAKAFGGSWP